ncbi:MAG: hypothetical protein RL398_1488 [Planctomycetota bacterium]|jgi:hypothetical protein
MPFSSYNSMLRSLGAAIAVLSCASAQDAAVPQRLRGIEIVRQDVFGSDYTEKYTLSRLVNALHATTKRAVIARELWIGPGDPIDAATVAEIERNLRALGIFAEVKAELLPTESADLVDLRITTKDKLSLSFGGGGSYVGGVSGFRAQIGESNFLGNGDRIITSFAQNSDGEYRGAFAYTDLHVLGSWHTATIRGSRSDEGDSIGLDVRRPIKHLHDPRGYGGGIHDDRQEVEYYRNGDTAASVDQHTTDLVADVTWATGPADGRRYYGLLTQWVATEYGMATGPLAPEVRVPGDTESLFVGVHGRWELITGFREVRGFDTLDYVQDLQLGLTLAGRGGARIRHEDAAQTAVQPDLGADVTWAEEIFGRAYATASLSGNLRWDDDRAVGWHTRAGTWLYAATGERNLLAFALNYDAAEETQDLPIEFTLGEDNGLRGYPARQFAGTRRIRANLENRFDTGVAYATCRLGLVAFADAGWIGDEGDMDGPFRSVGAGLRIGSKSLFGSSILRMDVAKPLDDVIDASDGWKLSITVGQVFTFGGYASTLSTR